MVRVSPSLVMGNHALIDPGLEHRGCRRLRTASTFYPPVHNKCLSPRHISYASIHPEKSFLLQNMQRLLPEILECPPLHLCNNAHSFLGAAQYNHRLLILANWEQLSTSCSALSSQPRSTSTLAGSSGLAEDHLHCECVVSRGGGKRLLTVSSPYRDLNGL